MRRLALVSVLAVLAGCPDRSVSEVEPEQSRVEQIDHPLVINNDVDILFVIDNSGSMDDEQASLTANFDRFIDVLDSIEGGLPDVHLGVATSDMGTFGVVNDGQCSHVGDGGRGDNGLLHVGAAVIDVDPGTGAPARYLSDIGGPTPGTRVQNYDQGGTVSLTTAFTQIGTVGTDGCGFEAHLESMRAALTNPTNGSFLRDDAHLAVVIVADEDDCSASDGQLFANAPTLGPLDSFRCFDYGVECDQADLRGFGTKTNCHPRDPSPYLSSPAEYVEFLTGLKPVGTNVIVAGIIGDREPVIVEQNDDHTEVWPTLRPSCTYPNPDPLGEDQNAAPGIRLGSFLDGFPAHSQQATICAEDLSGAISDVAQVITDNLTRCVRDQLADTDPTTPELDYECQISLVSAPDSVDAFDTPIPECDATASEQPCWRLIDAPVECNAYPTHLALEIVRTDEPPDGTRISGACVVE